MNGEQINFKTLRELVEFQVADLLQGPTLEDRIHAIQPGQVARRALQSCCRHEDWDAIYMLCRRCGMTKQQYVFGG